MSLMGRMPLTGIYGCYFFIPPSIPPQKARILKTFQASSSARPPFQVFRAGYIGAIRPELLNGVVFHDRRSTSSVIAGLVFIIPVFLTDL